VVRCRHARRATPLDEPLRDELRVLYVAAIGQRGAARAQPGAMLDRITDNGGAGHDGGDLGDVVSPLTIETPERSGGSPA